MTILLVRSIWKFKRILFFVCFFIEIHLFSASWRRLIDDCLPYEHEKVRMAAASALAALIDRHYVKDNEPIHETCHPIIEKCRTEVVSQTSESNRIGYAVALGMCNSREYVTL